MREHKRMDQVQRLAYLAAGGAMLGLWFMVVGIAIMSMGPSP